MVFFIGNLVEGFANDEFYCFNPNENTIKNGTFNKFLLIQNSIFWIVYSLTFVSNISFWGIILNGLVKYSV